MIGDDMICPDCETEFEGVHDTLYSNITTNRCNEGDHTGDVYWCGECEQLWVDDFLTGEFYEFAYS